MSQTRWWFVACLLLCVGGMEAGAQSDSATTGKFRIFVGGGYERSVSEDRFIIAMEHSLQWPRWWDTLEGTASGYDIRVGATYRLLPSLDLVLRLERAKLGGLPEQEVGELPILLEAQQIPVNMSNSVRLAFGMTTYRLDLSVRQILPFARLALEGGLTIADRRFDSVRVEVALNYPENARLKNPNNLPSEYDGRLLILHKGTWPESNHLVLGGVVGLSLTIPVLDRFEVVPELLLRKEFTPPVKGAEWPSFYGSAGLSIAYTL